MSRRPRPPSATVVVKRWGPTSSDGATPARFGRQQPGLRTGQDTALSIRELRQCANASLPMFPVPAQPKPDGASGKITSAMTVDQPHRIELRRLLADDWRVWRGLRLAGPASGGARRSASCIRLEPRRLDGYGRLR